MKLGGAAGPLPGIGVRGPGDIGAVKLVETLVSPPGTLSRWKGVDIARDRHAVGPCADIGLMDDGRATHVRRDTDMLVDPDAIGIGNLVVGGESLPGDIVAAGDRTQSVATGDNIGLVG